MAMITINLEFLSWLSESLEIEKSGNSLHLEHEVEEGSTVKDLFCQISAVNPRFEQSIFDIDLEKLSGKVCILYNNRPLELENGLETRLKDGDSLIFVPFIQGG